MWLPRDCTCKSAAPALCRSLLCKTLSSLDRSLVKCSDRRWPGLVSLCLKSILGARCTRASPFPVHKVPCNRLRLNPPPRHVVQQFYWSQWHFNLHLRSTCSKISSIRRYVTIRSGTVAGHNSTARMHLPRQHRTIARPAKIRSSHNILATEHYCVACFIEEGCNICKPVMPLTRPFDFAGLIAVTHCKIEHRNTWHDCTSQDLYT